MIKTMKVMLCPNHRQKTKLFACAGFARFSYNWAVDYEQKNNKEEKTNKAKNKKQKEINSFRIVICEKFLQN